MSRVADSLTPAARTARLLTEVLAPAVVISLLLLVVGWHAYDSSLAGLGWGMAAALFGSIIPFAVILRGVRSGTLSDRHVGRREQRRTPLIIGLASVSVGIAALVVLGAARELLAALGAVLIGGFVSMAVNTRWKMSIHTDVASSAVAILAMIYGWVALVATPLVVLVAWSRVRLRDHTIPQTIVGGVLGALVTGVAFGLLR